MISAPLPIAPRPHPGEAVSSWVRRIGARYDILADNLVEHVLDRPGRAVGVASTLDYRAAPDVEAALANATRISPAAVSNLRIAGDDGRNSCWHRWALAWCPICIRADLADHGEIYERAIWRLGSCVVCPEHNVPLEDSCCRCPFEDRCHFSIVQADCWDWPATPAKGPRDPSRAGRASGGRMKALALSEPVSRRRSTG